MNNTIRFSFTLLAASLLTAPLWAETPPLNIAQQGSFAVGGRVIQRPGEFDPHAFEGWGKAAEAGQTIHADHAAVQFQIPTQPHSLPLIFVHGYGQSSRCWQSTPDGREGFSSLMLRHRYSAYLIDLPGRGHAGRTSSAQEMRPLADEQFWFGIFRIGQYPHYNPGVQFPQDSESLNQFFRQMTPDLSDHDTRHEANILGQLADQLGGGVLVTHSAGGFPGWLAAAAHESVKAIVSYEPGGFVFPKGEAPAPMPSLTGTLKGVELPMEEYERLTKIPIILYFGDYIPETPSDHLGSENWRVRLAMARRFVDTINRHGGNATLVELPQIGINGNTHFLMSDLNNAQLADLLADWLEKHLIHPSQTL